MAGESARKSARRQREKAERLLRAAELHERGAQGEETTAEVLAALPPDHWTVLHDLAWPGRRYANVDHIAIGPPGVFVIDSKNWSGQITVRDQVLRQNGYRREPAVAGAAEAALAVAQLTAAAGPDVVHPVLCFVTDEPLVGWARGVMVCSTSNLVQMLGSRPQKLSMAEAAEISLQLDALLVPAGSARRGVPTGTPPRRRASAGSTVASARGPRRASSPSRSTRRRRSGPGIGRLLLGLGLLGVLVLAPGLVTGLGQAVAQLLVSK